MHCACIGQQSYLHVPPTRLARGYDHRNGKGFDRCQRNSLSVIPINGLTRVPRYSLIRGVTVAK